MKRTTTIASSAPMAVSCDPSRCRTQFRAKERRQIIEMAFCAWFFLRRRRPRLAASKSKARRVRSPRRSKPSLSLQKLQPSNRRGLDKSSGALAMDQSPRLLSSKGILKSLLQNSEFRGYLKRRISKLLVFSIICFSNSLQRRVLQVALKNENCKLGRRTIMRVGGLSINARSVNLVMTVESSLQFAFFNL